MSDAAGGKGSAHNATVLAGASTAELQEALAARAAEYEAQAPSRRIEGLKAKIAKLEAHLESAKKSLAAEQAAAKKGTN